MRTRIEIGRVRRGGDQATEVSVGLSKARIGEEFFPRNLYDSGEAQAVEMCRI